MAKNYVADSASRRIDFLIQTRAKHAVFAIFKNGDDGCADFLKNLLPELNQWLVYQLIDYDPTSNKKYVQWLLNEYVDGAFNFKSNKEDIRKTLEIFDRYQRVLSNKDIHRYSLFELKEETLYLKSLPEDTKLSGKALSRLYKQNFEQTGMVTVFYQNKRTGSKVIRLNDFLAAKYYAMGTRWCIAKEEFFKIYQERGELFCVFYHKHKFLVQFTLSEDVNANAIWGLSVADDKDQSCYCIDDVTQAQITKRDLDFGMMVSEIMIWSALKNGVKLNNHINRLLFSRPSNAEVPCLSRYITMNAHRISRLSNSEGSLRLHFIHWNNQFDKASNCLQGVFTPPLKELLQISETNQRVLGFY